MMLMLYVAASASADCQPFNTSTPPIHHPVTCSPDTPCTRFRSSGSSTCEHNCISEWARVGDCVEHLVVSGRGSPIQGIWNWCNASGAQITFYPGPRVAPNCSGAPVRTATFSTDAACHKSDLPFGGPFYQMDCLTQSPQD